MIKTIKGLYGFILPYQLQKYNSSFTAKLTAGTITFFVMLFLGFILFVLKCPKQYNTPDHIRNPHKYKRTIKEGLFFNTTYYTEK